jgi:protein TonB
MEKQVVDLRKQYPLNIRLSLLITIVLLILGFVFIPEVERKPYIREVRGVINVEKLPPQLQNILKPPPPPKPKMPVAAKSDKEVEAETIEKTDFTGLEKKADIDVPPPRFVPYEVEPKVLNPKVLKDYYPEVARRLGIEGTLYLEMWVDKEGNVRQVIIKKPLHPSIDEEAKKRAYQLKFTPAMQRDKPVDVWISFPVVFKLEQ